MIEAFNDIINSYKLESTENYLVRIDIFNDDVAEEIESFALLPSGWKFGRGGPASEESIKIAKYLYTICRLNGFTVEPYSNDDGSISLLAIFGDHSLDIEVINSDQLKLRYEVGKGLNFRVIWKDKIIKFNELEYNLLVIRSKCQTTLFETSTSKITAQGIKDSGTKVYLSHMKEEFPYLAKNAESKQGFQYVNT